MHPIHNLENIVWYAFVSNEEKMQQCYILLRDVHSFQYREIVIDSNEPNQSSIATLLMTRQPIENEEFFDWGLIHPLCSEARYSAAFYEYYHAVANDRIMVTETFGLRFIACTLNFFFDKIISTHKFKQMDLPTRTQIKELHEYFEELIVFANRTLVQVEDREVQRICGSSVLDTILTKISNLQAQISANKFIDFQFLSRQLKMYLDMIHSFVLIHKCIPS